MSRDTYKWAADGLIDGSAPLNSIPHADLQGGDLCVVIKQGDCAYHYVYDGLSEASQDVPNVIAPQDAGANPGRWLLHRVYDTFVRVNLKSEYNNGTVSSNTTINWNNGNNQRITLGGNITLTFSNMGVGHKQLKVIQDGTGGRTPTLPSGKWPGGTESDFSTGASVEDILSIYYDGINYYYQLTKGWA